MTRPTSSPLRVAHLTATFPPYLGGAGTACFHTAVELSRRSHHVEVFTAEAEGVPPEADGVVVHRLKPLLAFGNAPLIPAIAGVSGFDVVHLHYPFIFGTELTLAGRLRRRSRTLFVSYHNRLIGEGYRRPLFWIYEQTWGRFLPRHADRLCVLSDAHAETVPYLRKARRREPQKFAVLPNGVDLERFSPGRPPPGLRPELGIPDDAIVAVFVATLDRAHYFKRLDLAIEALALAGDERLQLLVVGGGEWLDRYRGEAARAGLRDRVHFAGPQTHERLPELLRASDFLLLTSDLEASPLVLLEAMACGLPTVCTDLPGVMATARQGETAVVAPRGDGHALAAAIRTMVEAGVEGRSRMGGAARAMCERDHGWSVIVERLEESYRAALERH